MDLIAAADARWGIGREGQLLFHIPEDLARFRRRTLGKCILYGRHTMETFPEGKPLEGRENLVLTRHPDTLPPGCRGVSDLSLLPDLVRDREVYLVGGASVYEALLDACRYAYITRVDLDCRGDAFLRNLDEAPDWRLISRSGEGLWGEYRYRFCVYEHLGSKT